MKEECTQEYSLDNGQNYPDVLPELCSDDQDEGLIEWVIDESMEE